MIIDRLCMAGATELKPSWAEVRHSVICIPFVKLISIIYVITSIVHIDDIFMYIIFLIHFFN